MPLSLLDDPRARLQFAGHETFPLRHGWLKKAYDAVKAEESAGIAPGAVFNEESAIATFGVGRNMVLSIRHWALATDVLAIEDSGDRAMRLTRGRLGNLLFGTDGDPYLEHPGSMWLLHWMLASKPGRATAWHWAFNEFHEPSFDRELMRIRLHRRCEELRGAGRLSDRQISDVTVRRDIECLVRTYFAGGANAKKAAEDSLESPLAELGLIQKAGVGEVFRFRRGPKASLPDAVFLFALLDFWSTYHPARRTCSVDFLTFERGAPGQVFLLDEEAVADRLARMEAQTGGALRWDESSGMRQIYAHDLDLDRWAIARSLFEMRKARAA